MKNTGRRIGMGLLIIMLSLCAFGLVGTFESLPALERSIWRTVYGLVGVACVCGLIRPVRCEIRRYMRS